MRDSRARERGEDDAAEAVAERIAVARIEAVYLIDTALLRLGDDARLARERDVIIRHTWMTR
jgi:hypothetical protein